MGFLAPVIAAAAINAAGVVAFGTTLTIAGVTLSVAASAAVVFGATLALGLIQYALSPKPKTPNLGQLNFNARERKQTLRQAITPRRLIYGEMRVGGPIAFFKRNSATRYFMVILLASHEIEAIDVMYMNDQPYYLDQDVDDNGFLNIGPTANSPDSLGNVRVFRHLGGTQGTIDNSRRIFGNATADGRLLSQVDEWSSNHTFDGIAYVVLEFFISNGLSFLEIFQSGLPNFTFWVKGKKILDTRDSTTRWTPNSALCIHDYLSDSKYGLDFNSSEINDTFTDTAANTSDEFVVVKEQDFTVTDVDADTDHIRFGDDKLIVQTGDKVWIATSGSLPGGLSASTDYFVIVKRREKFTYEKGPSPGSPAEIIKYPEIQLATSYANALAGTNIDITSEGTGTHTVTRKEEPRYTANGVVELDRRPSDIIEEIRSSFGGRIVYVGGTWRILAGEYQTPTITLDENDVIEPIKVQTKLSRRDRFNAVKGLFVSPINNSEATDYPLVSNSTYEAQDNGKQLLQDLDFPFTSRSSTAQRLAKIELERARQEISLEAKFSLAAMQVQAGDNVMFTNDRFGWSSKVFEVVGWKLSGEEINDVPALIVEMTLRETASAIFDFTAVDDETVVDPAPDTNLISPFAQDPPSDIEIVSDLDVLNYGSVASSVTKTVNYGSVEDPVFGILDFGSVSDSGQITLVNTDGTLIPRMLVRWTPPSGSVRRYEIQYRDNTQGEEFSESIFSAASQPFIYINNVKIGHEYEVRVRALNSLNVASEWVS